MYEDIAVLVSKAIVADEIGNQIAQESRREVFAQIESVGQSEHFAAARSGMKADTRLAVNSLDYCGETAAELGGVRYQVYRTFRREADDRTELYLTNAEALNAKP